MGLNVKTADGKSGYFDANAFMKDNVPGASISDYDSQNGILKFKTQDGKDGSFNVKQMLADEGTSVVGHQDFNTPVTAADSSPLSWKERGELGLLTHESTDFQKMIDGISQAFGGKQAGNLTEAITGQSQKDKALAAGDNARAIRVLKTKFEDATVSNGNIVVKQNGVWKKADSSSDSIGEDAAHFIGSSGFSLMGAIAGGMAAAPTAAPLLAAGPVGAIAGAGVIAAGAFGGAALGEVAKEATAVGIAGGAIDYQAAGRDILTNGLMNLAGEGLAPIASAGIKGTVKAAGALGGKVFGKSAATVAADAAMHSELGIVKGFKTIADTADSKVKDSIAAAYSAINPALSKEPLRAAIDSSENMSQAWAASRVSAMKDIEGKSGIDYLGRHMATELQGAVDGAMDKATEKFGTVLNRIKATVGDDFKIDLGQHAKDLEAAASDWLQGAPRDKRAFFDLLQNETKDLAKNLTDKGEEAVLYGKKAFDYTQRQFDIITNRLKSVDAFNKQAMRGDEDRLLNGAMFKVRAYLDDKRIFAAEHANLTGPWKDIKDMYGATKDAAETVWSKTFSNKGDISYAQNVAKGNITPNAKEALNTLNSLHPEAGIKQAVTNMQIKQAGIEMRPMFRSPDLVHGASAAAAVHFGGPAGAALLPAAVSPNLAARGARAAAWGSEILTKNALVQAMPAARQQASALLGMAHSAGFLKTLTAVQQREMLRNPAMFDAYMAKSSELSRSLAGTKDEDIMNAAIQQVHGEGDRGGNY